MASYLLDRITMGTILSFRYNRPKRGTSLVGLRPPRDILVIAPNFQGNLHGLKISHLTPSEQEYLQLVFRTLYTSPEDFFAPLISNIEQKQQELEILNRQKNDLIRQSQAFVAKPSSGGMFQNMRDKGKQVFGSIIGKIKTFGRTPIEGAPRAQVDPNIQKQIQINDQMTQQKQAEFEQYAQWVREQQQTWASVGRVPDNPYHMYHQVIKPMIGRIRMPNMYRKFNVQYIKNPRIVKSPGVIIDPNRRG